MTQPKSKSVDEILTFYAKAVFMLFDRKERDFSKLTVEAKSDLYQLIVERLPKDKGSTYIDRVGYLTALEDCKQVIKDLFGIKGE
jgi:hypothetical protein